LNTSNEREPEPDLMETRKNRPARWHAEGKSTNGQKMSLTKPTKRDTLLTSPINNGDNMSKMIQLELPFPDTMTTIKAVDIIDGFVAGSAQDIIHAYQFLIDNGVVWSLQGRYGRQAQHLIEVGLCTKPSNNQPYSC
jgi:hypothetical protein